MVPAERRRRQRTVRKTTSSNPSVRRKEGGHGPVERSAAPHAEARYHRSSPPTTLIDMQKAVPPKNAVIGKVRRPSQCTAGPSFAEGAMADPIERRFAVHLDNARTASARCRSNHRHSLGWCRQFRHTAGYAESRRSALHRQPVGAAGVIH